MYKSTRQSDAGGEITASSVGANVKILWKGEELERVHFPLLQVPWSFVGRLRDEAEKNEHQGMMTVDLAQIRHEGVAIFADDFPNTFQEVFVRRFVPCLNEKFNQRDPGKPLSKLPDDVGDALRLLVICERLKAAMKQDVKEHIDRLLIRSQSQEKVKRVNESPSFKVFQASLELDPTVPPRSSLQERVVHRSLEMMVQALPESLDALTELLMLSCEMRRHEMCGRIFRATSERTLEMAGKLPSSNNGLPAPPPMSSSLDRSAGSAEDMIKEVQHEREKLEREKREFRAEQERIKNGGETSFIGVIGQRSFANHSTTAAAAAVDQSGTGSINLDNLGSSAILAFKQGVVLEKIGKSTGNRIFRITGDALEWRKDSGRFTKEHTIQRGDIVNVKMVDQERRTFLLSTRTGLLSVRAISDHSATLFLQGIESWMKGSMAGARTKQKAEQVIPAAAATQNTNRMGFSTRFPRLSSHISSFSQKKPEKQMQVYQPTPPIPKPMNENFSFNDSRDYS